MIGGPLQESCGGGDSILFDGIWYIILLRVLGKFFTFQ
jgi:hypothetical protein